MLTLPDKWEVAEKPLGISSFSWKSQSMQHGSDPLRGDIEKAASCPQEAHVRPARGHQARRRQRALLQAQQCAGTSLSTFPQPTSLQSKPWDKDSLMSSWEVVPGCASGSREGVDKGMLMSSFPGGWAGSSERCICCVSHSHWESSLTNSFASCPWGLKGLLPALPEVEQDPWAS